MKNEQQRQSNKAIESSNSGGYDPGPVGEQENDFPTAELWGVQSHLYDLAVEEFAEGPYGAAHNESRLGKVSEWKPGQAVSGRFRDANMIDSDRRTAIHEDESTQSPRTLEEQN